MLFVGTCALCLLRVHCALCVYVCKCVVVVVTVYDYYSWSYDVLSSASMILFYSSFLDLMVDVLVVAVAVAVAVDVADTLTV